MWGKRTTKRKIFDYEFNIGFCRPKKTNVTSVILIRIAKKLVYHRKKVSIWKTYCKQKSARPIKDEKKEQAKGTNTSTAASFDIFSWVLTAIVQLIFIREDCEFTTWWYMATKTLKDFVSCCQNTKESEDQNINEVASCLYEYS